MTLAPSKVILSDTELKVKLQLLVPFIRTELRSKNNILRFLTSSVATVRSIITFKES
jgi:hypothetical protein